MSEENLDLNEVMLSYVLRVMDLKNRNNIRMALAYDEWVPCYILTLTNVEKNTELMMTTNPEETTLEDMDQIELMLDEEEQR